MTEAADQISTVVTKHMRLLLVRSYLAAGQKPKHQGPLALLWERVWEKSGPSEERGGLISFNSSPEGG